MVIGQCSRDSTSFETLSMPFSTCCLCHNQLHYRIRIEGSCRDRKQSTENDISTGSGSMDSSTCPEFSTHVVSSTGDTSRSPKLDFIEARFIFDETEYQLSQKEASLWHPGFGGFVFTLQGQCCIVINWPREEILCLSGDFVHIAEEPRVWKSDPAQRIGVQ